ncbi:MAG: nucleotide exchange factor GrpE [Lachnospiraceae bacterium]|nr:nucleotide exchange factor GrpE [Lachnospiraceae bacterium]
MEEKRELEQELEQEKASQEEASAEETEKNVQEPETAESGVPSGAEEGREESEEEQASGPGEKKGFFRKKEKKDKKDEQIAELTDKVKRQLAEFENFRNRTEKEKSQMYTIGAKDVIEKILPVVDNFERGIKSIPEEEREAPVASGMEMIYKQLMTVLTDLGVTPIEAVGQEFDPNLHNAVMHVENEELGENIVAEEFQKGYQYKDAVLRHSMVSVAN